MNLPRTRPTLEKRAVALAVVGLLALAAVGIALPFLAPEFQRQFQSLGSQVSVITFIVVARPMVASLLIACIVVGQAIVVARYIERRQVQQLKLIKVLTLLDLLVLLILVGAVYAPILEQGQVK